jgi:hypothetical protein
MRDQPVDSVLDLTDPSRNRLYNMALEQARPIGHAHMYFVDSSRSLPLGRMPAICGNGPENGSRSTACFDCEEPFATRRPRNATRKTIGKPCA